MPINYIPTSNQWRKIRDEAGGKSNLVSSVNVSKLLDAWHKKNNGEREFAKSFFPRIKEFNQLHQGLTKYEAAVRKKNRQLADKVAEILKEMDAQTKLAEKIANPAHNVVTALVKLIADAKTVAASGDETAYQKMWGGSVRLVGTGMGTLAKLDKGVAHIHAVWLPITSSDWSLNGKNVAPTSLTDPAQRKAKVKAAAKQIGATAMKIHSEFKAMNLTH